MATEIVALFIPMVFFLVTGLVIVTIVYYQSREKQLLIEKGLTPSEIKDFLQKKKDPYIMMKIGIVSIFFGLGLGLGLILEDYTSKDYWVPLFLFLITGIGFVVSNVTTKNLRDKEPQ